MVQCLTRSHTDCAFVYLDHKIITKLLNKTTNKNKEGIRDCCYDKTISKAAGEYTKCRGGFQEGGALKAEKARNSRAFLLTVSGDSGSVSVFYCSSHRVPLIFKA